MKLTRRDLIAASTGSSAMLSMAGCLSRAGIEAELDLRNRNPRVKFSGNVSTGEPLIEDVELTTQTAYPNHYSALIASQDEADRIRWDYVRREVPQLIGELESIDFGSGFAVFFGMVLPATKQLQPVSVSFEDGTLYSEYRIESRSSAASELLINTHIREVKHEKHPKNFEVSVRY